MIGKRITDIRSGLSQSEMADLIGVHKNTYARWERGEREPSASDLVKFMERGWNVNWILSGEGPERLESLSNNALRVADGGSVYESQSLIPEKLTLAVQLAQQALDGNVLDPPDYAELLGLIYHALVNGLESAQVLAFAKPAARGLGVSDGRKTVGGSGKQTAG